MISASVGRICWICVICKWVRNLQIFEYPRIAQRNRGQSADCADQTTAPNTSMSDKHPHITFILGVCSESMNDVTDNAKNNFGDPLDAKYIACARSVIENVGLLLKNSYVASDNFNLALFPGNAFVPR